MTPRQALISLKYNGQDISKDVTQFITSFQYVDRSQPDKMDELSVSFQDIAGLWRGAWWPEQGAKFEAIIETHNWFQKGESLMRDCGSFEIDDLSSSGPPSVFTVSAVAVGISSSIRRQQNTKAWESVTVQAIAQEIAGKHGFKLKWYSGYNPTLDRYDQKSESDLAFLRKVCEYTGLMLKITDEMIVIFRGEEFDKEAPVFTIKKGLEGLTGYSFNANSADVYSACEIKYYDAAKKELVEYLFTPDGISGTRGGSKASKSQTPRTFDSVTRMENTAPADDSKKADEIADPPIGQVLKINRRCSSLAEAEEIAKAALRDKNMRMVKGSLSFAGNIKLYSGMNIAVEGFGRWDSVTFQIEEITHSYDKSSGLRTEAQLRGVLGY